MDLISVIIPYFNKRKFIYSTIKSVTSQTYKKLEIIIIYDDHSKKDLEFIRRIKSIDSRIRLIVNKKNIGAGFSRNKGIRFSNGTYIAFLDSDDLWNKNKLEKQLTIMKKRKLDITHTSYFIINENDKILNKRKAKHFINLNSLVKSCDIGLSTVMLKSSILIKKDVFPNLKTKEDYVFWLNLLKRNIKIYGINDTLVRWRNVKNSLSSSVLQKLKDGFSVYNKHLKMNFINSLYFLVLLSVNALLKKINFK